MSVKSTKPKEKKVKKEPKIGEGNDQAFRRFLSLQRFIRKTFSKGSTGKYQYYVAVLGYNPQDGKSSRLMFNHCNGAILDLFVKYIDQNMLEQKKKVVGLNQMEELLLDLVNRELKSVTKKEV